MGTRHHVNLYESAPTLELTEAGEIRIKQALTVLITRCILAVLFSTVFCVALVYLLMGGDMTRTGVTLLMSGIPALYLVVSK